MTLPRVNNTFSVTDLKEMEICDLFDLNNSKQLFKEAQWATRKTQKENPMITGK